jgi:hypothetical protein
MDEVRQSRFHNATYNVNINNECVYVYWFNGCVMNPKTSLKGSSAWLRVIRY